MNPINHEDFTHSLFALLKETFEGRSTAFGTMYLDQGTGFFATLDTINAEMASRPAAEGGTTIAAHCEHARFYLEFINNYLQENYKMVDWKESWSVRTVSEPEWDSLRGRLHKAYQNVSDTFEEIEEWNEYKISGAMGILTHTAYHLSAIRQIMKFV